MLKTIALIGLAAVLALPAASAFAVSGNSSSYGIGGLRPHRADAVADALPAIVESRQRKQGAREGRGGVDSPPWRIRTSPPIPHP